MRDFGRNDWMVVLKRGLGWRAQSARHPSPLTAGYTVIPMSPESLLGGSQVKCFGTTEESPSATL